MILVGPFARPRYCLHTQLSSKAATQGMVGRETSELGDCRIPGRRLLAAQSDERRRETLCGRHSDAQIIPPFARRLADSLRTRPYVCLMLPLTQAIGSNANITVVIVPHQIFALGSAETGKHAYLSNFVISKELKEENVRSGLYDRPMTA